MTPTFSGELMFKRYSDTSTQGQLVTFTVPSRDELEPFIGMEGKRFAAVLVLLGDDELPVDPPQATEATKGKAGTLCAWAAIRCTEPAFQQWVRSRIGQGDAVTEAAAATFIRCTCGVESRRDLDNDPDAGKAMRDKIIKPYAAWLKTQGATA